MVCASPERIVARSPCWIPSLARSSSCSDGNALSLHNAIVHSCDVFFFSVGVKLGIENLVRYADMVGFGHAAGVDLPGEAAGLVD